MQEMVLLSGRQLLGEVVLTAARTPIILSDANQLVHAACRMHQKRSCTELQQLHGTHHTVLDETNTHTCLRLVVNVRSRSSATRSSMSGLSHHQD